uniref:Coiled-coil domain containing 146 n=1 Tax=Leptobrachium leishanense TaxID=445787 RepID=A0A8C5QEJ6_9ANUR
MSQFEGEMYHSSDSSEEDEENKEKILYPLAPPNIQEESPKDVSSSPAFECLDELFSSGKIPGTRVAELKAKYTLLYNTLKSLQESEIRLLQNAKRFTNQLEQQQKELEKGDNFPEGSNTEVSRMRIQLLKYNNDLNEAEEREHHNQYRIESLLEEKRLLKREYERIPKAGDLEKKAKMLKESIEELQKENAQRRLEIKALREDVESEHRDTERVSKELETKLENQESVKEELVEIHQIPAQLGKDMERINRKIVETEKKKIKLEEQCQDVKSSLKQTEQKTKSTLEEKEEVLKELDEKRMLLQNGEQEFNQLTKLLEMSKEAETSALEERAMLELKLRHILIDKQAHHDALARKQKEKDKDLRNVKKIELQLKSASDAVEHTKTTLEKMKAEMDKFPMDDGTLSEKRMELQKDVEVLKRQLAQQHGYTAVEAHRIEQCIAEEERLVKAQNEHREELINLTRLAQIKADEREQKSRDFVKAQERHQKVLREIKGKDLIIGEHKKKNQDVQKRLQEFAKLYDVIRNERNKCVSLIQMATQRAAEFREKLKILGNEVEIQRTNVSTKDRGVQLIEREEEVCIFHEKISIQEMVLRNGDMEMMALDEKIRFLKMKVTEEKRQIEQITKTLPNKRVLESDLVVLQIQLSQCQDRAHELEGQAEDPSKDSRINALEGKEYTLQELLKRTEELELKVAEKEEQLLEKDFLYEQVSHLSEQLRIKVENSQQDTLTLAKKMNEMQRKIKRTTRKMMSLVAELSMQQANCIKLQQEARDKERFVETCYIRVEQGLPPSEDMEHEWKRMVHNEHRQLKERDEKAKLQEEEKQQLLPSGIYTTAEQRPNAYIPDDENALPLPRPYGGLAPFKPSEQGSSMRHIRKPVVKPIEI